MGFQDILAPRQKEVVELIMDRRTELKLYCPLSGELAEQLLDGSDLLKFQDAILQRIEDEQLPEKAERGLMAEFDGLDYVDDKVFSVFPSAEEVDGQLYGVAVCQLKGRLSPGELEDLKEFCAGQFPMAGVRRSHSVLTGQSMAICMSASGRTAARPY